MCKETVHHDRNLIRQEEIIVHQPVDIACIRVVITAGARPVLKRPVGGMVFVVNARLIRKIPPHHICRLCVVRVVRDENIQIAIGLGKHAFERKAEVVRSFKRWNNDRNERVDLC